jgi:hypothetical protein
MGSCSNRKTAMLNASTIVLFWEEGFTAKKGSLRRFNMGFLGVLRVLAVDKRDLRAPQRI